MSAVIIKDHSFDYKNEVNSNKGALKETISSQKTKENYLKDLAIAAAVGIAAGTAIGYGSARLYDKLFPKKNDFIEKIEDVFYSGNSLYRDFNDFGEKTYTLYDNTIAKLIGN